MEGAAPLAAAVAADALAHSLPGINLLLTPASELFGAAAGVAYLMSVLLSSPSVDPNSLAPKGTVHQRRDCRGVRRTLVQHPQRGWAWSRAEESLKWSALPPVLQSFPALLTFQQCTAVKLLASTPKLIALLNAYVKPGGSALLWRRPLRLTGQSSLRKP